MVKHLNQKSESHSIEIPTITQKPFLLRSLDNFLARPAFEQKLMNDFAQLVPQIDSGNLNWDSAQKLVLQKNDSKYSKSQRKLSEKISRIKKTCQALSEDIPVDMVGQVLTTSYSTPQLEATTARVRKIHDNNPDMDLDFLSQQALYFASQRKRSGSSLSQSYSKSSKFPRLLRNGMGAAVTVAAAFTLLRLAPHIHLPEKNYTLDDYRKNSPLTYSKVEKHFPEQERLHAAMQWLDHADGYGFDSRVTHNFTGVQFMDLKKNIITADYDMSAAKEYNKSYANSIMSTYLAITQLKEKSKQLTFEESIKKLQSRDLVMVNEAHETPEHIRHETLIIQGLAESGRPIRVGMEMFDKFFNPDLEHFMSYESSGGRRFKHRLEAECTMGSAWRFSNLFDTYRPLLDEMKRLRKSGVDIKLVGLERGFTQQQIYRGDDMYTRDRGMAGQLKKQMLQDQKEGKNNAIYVTITGAGHGAPQGHLESWLPKNLRENSSIVFFGNQPFSIKMEGVISKIQGQADNPQVQEQVRESNTIYMETGKNQQINIYDLSQHK